MDPSPAWRAYLPIATVGVVLALVPALFAGSEYRLSLAVIALVYAGYGIGFNLVFGSTRQLFLCVGALAGIGGYGSTVLASSAGWPVFVAVPAAVTLTAVIGAGLSLISVRRRLDVIFVGVVTLALSLMFVNLVVGERELTGGETGLVVPYDTGLLSARGVGAYLIFLSIVLLALALVRWLHRSHVGLAFHAIRDDDLAAELSGVDLARYKMIAGACGAAIIGLTGSLYAHYEGFISPAAFTLGNVDIPVLLMVAFGGAGSLLGPVGGAAIFTYIDEVLRPLGQLRDAVYGVVLLVLFLGFPDGLLPTLRRMAGGGR